MPAEQHWKKGLHSSVIFSFAYSGKLIIVATLSLVHEKYTRTSCHADMDDMGGLD